jgi:hypothetical protein
MSIKHDTTLSAKKHDTTPRTLAPDHYRIQNKNDIKILIKKVKERKKEADSKYCYIV